MELKVGGVDKKYELQCINKNRGPSVQVGPFVSYFKISDDSWYKENVKIISMKWTQELPLQPYIYVYIRKKRLQLKSGKFNNGPER